MLSVIFGGNLTFSVNCQLKINLADVYFESNNSKVNIQNSYGK